MNKLFSLSIFAIVLFSCNNPQNETNSKSVPADSVDITDQVSLIQDCPEEKIINRMPQVTDGVKPATENAYYIYNGERKEIGEFDAEWVELNCTVTETVVH